MLQLVPNTSAVVTGRALSAGLILAVACKRRIAVPSAQFLFHGLDIRAHAEDDERLAKWFAERTNGDADFWRALCNRGDTTFDAQKALSMGVIHEIREDVPE